MDPVELLRINLLTPTVLAFLLGILATLVRSDLKFPDQLYTALSIFLLLAIGLKGGVALSQTPFSEVWKPALGTLVLGSLMPLWCFGILRLGRLGVPDAAALAAHYGSVSAVTFIASLTFLDALGVQREGFMPTLVALLEVPAIVIALLLAQRGRSGRWGVVLHEVLAGRSILLLLGGLAIGFLSGPDRLRPVTPFFMDLFQGALTLFLLEMGMVAARRLRDLRRAGLFLVAFGVLMPVVHGALGVALGAFTGLSLGGSVVMGVLAASASYIAAPAAVRVALPEANPSLYLTAALGITFPFNLTVGIPLYYAMAGYIHGALGRSAW
jgi:hypothetical protein